MARLLAADVRYDAVGGEAHAPPAGSRRARWSRALAVAASLAAAAAALAAALPTLRRRPLVGGFLGRAVGLWAPPSIDQFFSLGRGLCVDIHGRSSPSVAVAGNVTVLSDGSSVECERACRADDLCSGYMTHETAVSVWSGGAGECALLTGSEFEPVAGDGSKSSMCFWRHSYQANTDGIYMGDEPEIPKVIWTFWENLPGRVVEPSDNLPAFVGMCVTSWRQLNPDYDIRLLNSTTTRMFLEDADLPHGFKDMEFRHQVSAIRLGLLVKHGGVWLDATTFLMKPLSDVVSRQDNERTFFHSGGILVPRGTAVRDRRVGVVHHASSWFLAVPPNDKLILRTKACMLEYFAKGASSRDAVDAGMFSPRQLHLLASMGLGEDMGPYLISDACMFKNIDEDLSIQTWWLSEKVRHVRPEGSLDDSWWYDSSRMRQELFYLQNDTLAAELTAPSVFALKFTRLMRLKLTDGIDAKVLWCAANTWHMVLGKLRVYNTGVCPAGGAR